MNKIILTIAGTALIAGTILTGCESSTKKVENARENLEDAKKDVADSKIELNQALQDSINSFKTNSEYRANAYDKSIASLKTKIANQKKENKVIYEKTLNELELKNKQLKFKLREYKEEGLDKWASFKKEFTHDMDELGEAINDLAKNNVK